MYSLDCDSGEVLLVPVKTLKGDGPFGPLEGAELVAPPVPADCRVPGVDTLAGNGPAPLSSASGAGFRAASGFGFKTAAPSEVNNNGSIRAVNMYAASSDTGPCSGCGGCGGCGGLALDLTPRSS